MKKRILLLTGNPGVGKTSVLLRIVESLKAKGYNMGGMVSRDVKAGGGRVGFEIVDLKTGRKGWLAHVTQKQGPQVGRYRVNLGDLDSIGVEAITNAASTSDVIIVDEIGPMELSSQKFKEAIRKVAEGSKLVVGVVHLKATDSLITEIRNKDDAELYLVTLENRGNMGEQVLRQALDFISRTA